MTMRALINLVKLYDENNVYDGEGRIVEFSLYEAKIKHRMPHEVEGVQDHLKAAGWENIGSGYFSEVFGKADRDYVIKVFERDSAYLAFLDLIAKHPNPHFPKVKGRVWLADHSSKFNAVRLEKLEPCNTVVVNGVYHVSLSGMMNAYIISKRHHLNSIQENLLSHATEYLRDKPQLVEALDLIDTLLGKYHLDISGHNVMMRRDGTPVIIDPIYH